MNILIIKYLKACFIIHLRKVYRSGLTVLKKVIHTAFKSSNVLLGHQGLKKHIGESWLKDGS